MEIDSGAMFASFVVGTIGFGLFLYGKKQQRVPQLVIGIALCGLPYLVTGLVAMLAVALALVVGLAVAVRAGA